jgi:DNA-binding transcriptional LysR family regulator
VALVACGVGVSLAPACVAQIQLPGVTYRELTESTPLLDVVLTWRDDESNPALLRFVETARETTGHAL